MRAMILAAGRGERMRPLTDDTPKPLLSLCGKALIDYHLEKLAAAGFRDVVINTHWHGEQLVAHVGDGSRFGLRVQWSAETDLLDTGGGIANALPLLGDGSFALVNGDVWSDYDYSALAPLPPGVLVSLRLVANPAHNPDGDFGLDERGGLHRRGHRRGTYAGIGVMHRALFDNERRRRFPLRDVLHRAIEAGKAGGEWFGGQWCDVGTPERLAQLQSELQGAAHAAPR